MQREGNKSKTRALVRILKRIEEGEDLRLMATEVAKIASALGPGEMAAAQDRLRESGYPDAVIAQLQSAFVLAGVYEQKRSHMTGAASEPHILQVVAAEHVMFRSHAMELERIVEDIRGLEQISDTSLAFCRLAHTVHHLGAMNEHFDREEDVILPYLQRQGWSGPCRTTATDHATLRTHIDNLTGLVTSLGVYEIEQFKWHLATGSAAFCACLHEHLSFEDGLLWPLALVVIDDLAPWRTITAQCDEIGYCGIHA